MRPAASTRTNTRSGAIETGPSTSGAVGNGWGIDFATPPQIRSSPFCIAIHTPIIDRKSTRLNSSHDQISYAVFCLKKKKKGEDHPTHSSVYGHVVPDSSARQCRRS